MKAVPYGLLHLDLRMKKVECLLMLKQYKKAAVFSYSMLMWMVRRRRISMMNRTFLWDCPSIRFAMFTTTSMDSLLPSSPRSTH